VSLIHKPNVSLGLAVPDLERIIETAPKRYKVYPIAKKNGGFRVIAQPSRELKVLQRFVMEKYLKHFPVHELAMAYAKGRNIYDNAAWHASNLIFLKLDFEGFFPSIKASDWRSFLRSGRSELIERGDIEISTRILFWGAGTREPYCLSIGAPTSPMLSNILLFHFDNRLSQLAMKHGVSYTRYADDITISADTIDQVISFERFVRLDVARMKSPNLKFNEKKRGLYQRGQRRMVTGLVVTPNGQVSIGRERKRLISALLHKLSLDEISMEQLSMLKGLLGFVIANEADFVDRMRCKYGGNVVDRALSARIPKRGVE
jgi:RNA-directed DNA polymerase